MGKNILIAISLFIMTQTMAHSWETLVEKKSFQDIWAKIAQDSESLKGAQSAREGSSLSLERSSRHWLPRIFLGGQWFQTNDSGQVFFNRLGERSVETSDFIVADLNDPGKQTFKTGQIGLDLPLFEGGGKQAQKNMYEDQLQAADHELQTQKIQSFVNVSSHYGQLLATLDHQREVMNATGEIKKIMSSYQVGGRNNLLGHSGLLGLKGIDKRAQALANQDQAQIQGHYSWLNLQMGETRAWIADEKMSAMDFAKMELNARDQENLSTSHSAQIMAADLRAQSMDKVSGMELARSLPRIGLFAQSNYFDGKRGSDNSQAFGIYLNWDLFNSDSYGTVGEARARSMAAHHSVSAAQIEEQANREQLHFDKKMMEQNLEILIQSRQLLSEQTVNAKSLFNSGLINALQLVEVFNRRFDVMDSIKQMQIQYLEVCNRLFQIEGHL